MAPLLNWSNACWSRFLKALIRMTFTLLFLTMRPPSVVAPVCLFFLPPRAGTTTPPFKKEKNLEGCVLPISHQPSGNDPPRWCSTQARACVSSSFNQPWQIKGAGWWGNRASSNANGAHQASARGCGGVYNVYTVTPPLPLFLLRQ